MRSARCLNVKREAKVLALMGINLQEREASFRLHPSFKDFFFLENVMVEFEISKHNLLFLERSREERKRGQ